MANEQLVQYIREQSKLGAVKETLEGALAEAGWAKNDIDEALKVAMPASMSSPDAMKSLSPNASALGASSIINTNAEIEATAPVSRFGNVENKPVFATGGQEGVAAVSGAGAKPLVGFRNAGQGVNAATASSLKTTPSVVEEKGKNIWKIVSIVVAALAVLFAGGIGYLYIVWGGTIKDLRSENENFMSRVAELEANLSAEQGRANEFEARVGILTAERDELLNELSFLFRIPSLVSEGVSRSATVNGILELEKGVFVLRTTHGIGVIVIDNKDQKITNALAPLVGQEASITGTYFIGGNKITPTALNGAGFEEAAQQEEIPSALE